MKKRLLSIIIAVCMIFTMLPAAALADETASGSCGAPMAIMSNGLLKTAS